MAKTMDLFSYKNDGWADVIKIVEAGKMNMALTLLEPLKAVDLELMDPKIPLYKTGATPPKGQRKASWNK